MSRNTYIGGLRSARVININSGQRGGEGVVFCKEYLYSGEIKEK